MEAITPLQAASGEVSCISKLRGVFRGAYEFVLVPFSLWFRNKQMTQFQSMRQEGKSTWGTWKRFSQFQSTHKKIQFCAVPSPCVSLWCLELLQPFLNQEETTGGKAKCRRAEARKSQESRIRVLMFFTRSLSYLFAWVMWLQIAFLFKPKWVRIAYYL